MNKIRYRLASSAAAVITVCAAANAMAADPQGRQAVVNDQRVAQTGTQDRPMPSSATADGRYSSEAGQTSSSTVTVAGNNQSAKAAGNAASSTLSANTADPDLSISAMPFATLSNHQSGSGSLAARSTMSASVPGGISASDIGLTGNANSGMARMNDGADTLTANAVGSAGDVLLTSAQKTSGEVSANADSRFTTGDRMPSVKGSIVTIDQNSTSAEATANRVTNTLAETSVAGSLDTRLVNRQSNTAEVSATSDANLTMSAGGIDQTALRVDSNGASALARGNVAENSVKAEGGETQVGGLGPIGVVAMARLVPASPTVTLDNGQTNTATVAAQTDMTGSIALNGSSGANQLGLTNNSGSAAGYGNVALNTASVDGRGQQLAMLSNQQVNTGPVSARVTAAYPAALSGGVNSSLVSITGNSLVATAVGNQVVNTLAVNR